MKNLIKENVYILYCNWKKDKKKIFIIAEGNILLLLNELKYLGHARLRPLHWYILFTFFSINTTVSTKVRSNSIHPVVPRIGTKEYRRLTSNLHATLKRRKVISTRPMKLLSLEPIDDLVISSILAHISRE